MVLLSLIWVLLLPFSLIFIYNYYKARKVENLNKVKIYQPLTTIISLFISFLSIFSPFSHLLFAIFIMIGMFIALIADFLNIDMTDFNVVIRGLSIFFLAYLVYTLTSFFFIGITYVSLIIISILCLFFIIIISLVWNGFSSKVEQIAMGLYGFLLSMMVASGLNTFITNNFSILSSVLLSLGFFFLFLGDIEFALSTYWKNLNFEFGPFLYAGGQLLVAISLFFVIL